MNKVGSSQLWVEEEEYLSATAARLPRGAVVVEIGTAQGGSAAILAAASAARDVEIKTFDIVESREARENLGSFDNVRYQVLSSRAAAAGWGALSGKKIDLLFIDGSHVLLDVWRDFMAWRPLLADGATLLFHDYDREVRGGVAHFGVVICLDALLRTGIIAKKEHVGRILSAAIGPGETAADDFAGSLRRVLRDYYSQVRRLCVLDLSRHGVAEGSPFSLLYEKLSATAFDRGDRQGTVVFGDMAGQAVSAGNFVLFPESAFLYYVYYCMTQRKDRILQLTGNRPEYFHVEELIQMLDHSSYGDDYLFNDHYDYSHLSIEDISRICAKELVRFSLLRRIVAALAA